ncbi:hypothetical protein BGZ60DRAFT_467561 [Tricladium varicosporioides]|nr:hypothetical protein BGZ60DRAFT_467561 [Hymenoscyphus varicosporioides]
MASLLMRPLLRPQTLGLGLGLSFATYNHVSQRPLRLDSSPILSTDSYRKNAQAPILRRDGGLNPGAVRQVSSGSIIGLCTGLLISKFSRPLVLLIGLLVVGIQWASSYGINVIPYNRLQKYATSVDLRSAVQDNVAFKLSFGMTFAMAAFMRF